MPSEAKSSTGFIADLTAALVLLGIVPGPDAQDAIRKAREFFNGRSLYENLVKLSAAITALHAYKLSIMRSEDFDEVEEEIKADALANSGDHDAKADSLDVTSGDVNARVESNKAYNEELEQSLAAQAFALCKVLAESADNQLQLAIAQAIVQDRKRIVENNKRMETEAFGNSNTISDNFDLGAEGLFQPLNADESDWNSKFKANHFDSLNKARKASEKKGVAITKVVRGWIRDNLPLIEAAIVEGKSVTLSQANTDRFLAETGLELEMPTGYECITIFPSTSKDACVVSVHELGSQA